MRWFHYVMVTVLGLLMAGTAQADGLPGDPSGGGPHLAITLVAESTQPAAGSNVTLALATVPQTGWHGYWQNPGDAGFPAKLDWTLPKGVTASEPVYPVPGRLVVADLMNYVFEKPYAPLVTLSVPAGLAAGTKLPIALHLTYLVCSAVVCVPEKADLSTELTIGNGAIPPESQARFDAWRMAVPKPLDARGTYQASGGRIRIAIPYPAGASVPKDVYFYPVTTGLIDYSAPQMVTQDDDRLVIETKSAAGGQGPLAGVLQIGAQQGLSVTATAGTVVSAAPATGATPSGDILFATLVALGGAMLGGLILNIMPCVFPILSLKALSLARGHLDEGAARREALAYTAGVVAVCVALGGVILGLRAGGSAVGWAFQLQDPRAIVVLLLLTVALSLNLSGVFEIPTPAFVNQAGGAGGAFATGALAAFIATPCTGPFMGAALGAALVLPWFSALAIFAGLGLGMAIPFLLIGFIPALRKRLPKPGAWMETFRRILSVPMWLTAIALAWVLGRQTGVDGMSLGLLVALGLAIVLWVGGQRQAKGLGFGTVAGVLLLAITVAGAWAIAGRHAPAAGAVADAGGAEPFTEAKLAELRKTNRPVFVYFTADWCLTCKVNEKAAIDTDATRKAFADHKVAVLLGDWTNGDPAMGRFIEAHNRAGVPLYLYYAPGAAEPQVLPQVLTTGLLAGVAMTGKLLLGMLLALTGGSAAVPNPSAWTTPTAPFRIAGNIYYVGTKGLASYLIVTPKGAILLDATMEQNVPAIEANIRTLGYKLSDVKILLNSHAHFDHAGGLAAMKRDTGAAFEAMAQDVWALEHGKHFGDQNYVGTFAPVKVDHVLHDGENVYLGGMTLRAVLTAGHTSGCTTWVTHVRFQGATRDVVFPCSLSTAGNVLVGNRNYPGIVADYRKSFARLGAIHADIVLPAHPELADVLIRTDRNRMAPDLLPKMVAGARADFEAELAKQQAAVRK